MNWCQKRRAKRKVKKFVNDAKSSAKDVFGNLEDFRDDLSDKAGDAAKDAKKFAKNARNDAEKHVNRLSNDAEKQFNSLSKDAKKAYHKASKKADKFADRAGDEAKDVYSNFSKFVDQAGDQAKDYFDDAKDFFSGDLNDIFENVSDFIDDHVSPVVSDIADRAKPVAKKVRSSVEDVWDQAQDNDHIAEATRRGEAAVAALRGDNSLANPQLAKKKNGFGRNVLIGLSIIAGAAGIYWLIKNFFDAGDDGWTAQRPSQPNRKDENVEWGDSPITDEPPAHRAADVESGVTDESDAEQAMTDEGGVPNQGVNYGEKAHVGDNPPEGYAIKGNERSMKYHTTDSAGYDRTNADVWFASEEDAEAAGFTKAYR